MYTVFNQFTNEIVFISDDIICCINFIVQMESKEYDEYLDYKLSCIENYEFYSDYYPTYCIHYKDKFYDITCLGELKKLVLDEKAR